MVGYLVRLQGGDARYTAHAPGMMGSDVQEVISHVRDRGRDRGVGGNPQNIGEPLTVCVRLGEPLPNTVQALRGVPIMVAPGRCTA